MLKVRVNIRLCRGHFPKGVFTDDAMGRAHLFQLVCVASLAPACADQKVEHLIGLWAPWMPDWEVQDLKEHLGRLTMTERWHSPSDIGRILYCTNAEREAWALWQILPCDMTPSELGGIPHRQRGASSLRSGGATRASDRRPNISLS